MVGILRRPGVVGVPLRALVARQGLPLADGLVASTADDGGRPKRAHASQNAVSGLLNAKPQFSASRVITPRQKVCFAAVGAAIACLFMVWPRIMAQVLVAGMSFGFVAGLAFRAALAWLGRRAERAVVEPRDEGLPIYTVLVPLFHEKAVLPQLVDSLLALDYPAEKLDVKLIVEEDDDETRIAAERLSPFETVVVPRSRPRTKPKACNFALQFARGSRVVVYDAEDHPEPDQLRKAAKAFRKDPGVTCFQARLAIDNAASGWLARMFALDYGIWFRTLLPGLASLHAPMPLGGTSNHFRTSDLMKAGAWDPFNVTEDADLGIRLARLDRRVSMLDSTTFEEAPCRFGPWFRQRTRWMKGYMQTLLVHTRDPGELARNLGFGGCAVIEMFLGGAVWSALVNPILWTIFVVSCLARSVDPALLDFFARISGLAFVAGNGLLVALSIAQEGRLRRLGSVLFALTYPVYWLLVSAAAYRALWQLWHDPFRWEKTPHGDAAL